MANDKVGDSSPIPAELRQRKQWVCAKDKVPKRPDAPTRNASTTDPATWGTYEQARAAVEAGKAEEAGFVFAGDDPYVGIDLDHCRDPETGEIEVWAREIIERLDSFSQPSVSGTGVHVFVRGVVASAYKKGNVEVYDRGRYFVTPETHLDGTPTSIRDVGDVLTLLDDLLPRKAKPTRVKTPTPDADISLRASDEDVVRALSRGSNASKFKALYDGRWERAGDYPSKSEADCALVSILAEKCSSPAQIDRIFRSSGLMDAKWDEVHYGDGETYGQHTIRYVLESRHASQDGALGTMTEQILAMLEGLELFCDPSGEAYVAVEINERSEVHRIESTPFERLLGELSYRSYGKAPSAEVTNAVVATLAARARYEGSVEEVFVRVGRAPGKVYVDLGDSTRRVVEIDEEGWRILDASPIRFRRRAGMLALPTPEHDGSLGWLRACLNVPEDGAWALVLGLLVGALHPEGPYPVGILHGEQGSAKSTAARLIRALVDPASPPLRGTPGSVDDLVIGASSSWMLAFDNLSGISGVYSDVICQLSTGGGYAKRRLYRDDDEILFDLKRPVLINGINDLAKREDLASRALIIRMPHIPRSERRREAVIMAEFEAMYPKVLGALYDAVSCALGRVSEVELNGHPRMADFAAWIVAAEPALPLEDGEFLRAYEHNQEEVVMTALESDAVAVGIINLAYSQPGWQGTMSEMLHILNRDIGEDHRRDRWWPKNARALSDRVSRLASFLSSAGVTVEHARDNERNRRKIIVLHVDDTVPRVHLDEGYFDSFILQKRDS